MKKIAVIGAGPTGLSVAYKLSKNFDVTIFEKNNFIGGESTTFKYDDYSLDLGPHKLYTQNDEIQEFVSKTLSNELLSIPKKSRLVLSGKFFSFPIKIGEIINGLPVSKAMNLALSYVKSMLVKERPEDDYESYLKNRFGSGLYELVFEGYARKIWEEPSELSKELAESRVSFTNLFELIKRAIFGDEGKKELSAKHFFYPKKGILSLWKKILNKSEEFGARLLLGEEIISIDKRENKFVIKTINEKFFEADIVINTAPIHELATMYETPEEVIKNLKKLKFNELKLFYLILDKERLFDDNWIFVPEESYVFNRLFEQKSFSPHMIPDNKTVLCVEVTKKIENKEKTYRRILEQLEGLGIIGREEVLDSFVKTVKNAYPIYDKNFRKHLDKVLNYFDSIEGLFTIGKKGAFNYVGMLDCMDIGFTTAEYIINKEDDWKAKRKSFRDYVVID